MDKVDLQMGRAVSEEVFPGAVVLVWQKGHIEFHHAYGLTNLFTQEKMTCDTVFDLASLTKPLATTLAVLKLIASGEMTLSQTLGEFLPELENSSKSSITLEMLLRHTSGYPAHRNYFERLSKFTLIQRKEKLKSFLCCEELVHPVGETTLYSDLGFMLLAEIVEFIVNDRLDSWLANKIYGPLELNNLFFNRHFECLRQEKYAATEWCPIRQMVLSGQVHDDNAYALGGVCGHAGLFGTAGNVLKLLVALLQSYHGISDNLFFPPSLVRQFLTRPGDNVRPLGFDFPVVSNSSSGKMFSVESVGHLGFTGTSFWMDLSREIIIILLTNRVHPYRSNEKIRSFRPQIHDAIMRDLGVN